MCAGAATFLLAGCQSEDLYNPDAVIEKYNSAWEETFGEIDANQTWNMATTRTVDVAIGYEGNYTVKLYTANPKKEGAYLLGEYEAEGQSTHSYTLAMPSALSYVYVALADENGYILKSTPLTDGAFSASFGEAAATTRTVTEYENTGSFTVSEGSAKHVYNQSLIGEFLEVIPESTSNRSATGVSATNFLYKATGKTKISIIPMYTVTAGNTYTNGITLGIYWYENGEQKTQDIWNNKVTSETTTTSSGSGGYGPGGFGPGGGQNQITTTTYTISSFAGSDDQVTWVNSGTDDMYALASNGEAFWKEYNYYRSDSINIITEGDLTLGFYIKAGSLTYYTESELNGNLAKAATFPGIGDSKKTYLGLEDYDESGDNDLNDLVVEISGVEIVDKDPDPDPDPITWTIGCEDLGSEFDYDFNDVVFSVNYVSGKETATITPLAAGGTLETYIGYTYNSTKTTIGEIHELLGGSDYETMLNTTSFTGAGEAIEIPVSTEFNIAEDMGGLFITVKKADESDNAAVEIKAPTTGAAPQMICIDGDWLWPLEKVSISEAYPKFSEWGSKYTETSEWASDYTAGSVITK